MWIRDIYFESVRQDEKATKTFVLSSLITDKDIVYSVLECASRERMIGAKNLASPLPIGELLIKSLTEEALIMFLIPESIKHDKQFIAEFFQANESMFVLDSEFLLKD
jgi:hypothetical protein